MGAAPLPWLSTAVAPNSIPINSERSQDSRSKVGRLQNLQQISSTAIYIYIMVYMYIYIYIHIYVYHIIHILLNYTYIYIYVYIKMLYIYILFLSSFLYGEALIYIEIHIYIYIYLFILYNHMYIYIYCSWDTIYVYKHNTSWVPIPNYSQPPQQPTCSRCDSVSDNCCATTRMMSFLNWGSWLLAQWRTIFGW